MYVPAASVSSAFTLTIIRFAGSSTSLRIAPVFVSALYTEVTPVAGSVFV